MVSSKKKQQLRNKCDKKLQEIGRLLYQKCEVCGKPMSCLHHYHPKSTCSALRYNIKNCIPLCAGCHFSHHNGNPEIHNTINKIRGEEWIEELRTIKRNDFVKDTIERYETVLKNLELIKPVKV